MTSIDANEEEVDDIGNGCGDYYDDSAVKADSWDKRKKGKSRFKKKQEMGEQRKAKNFLPEQSDKVLRAYAKSDKRIAEATDFLGKNSRNGRTANSHRREAGGNIWRTRLPESLPKYSRSIQSHL